jgi:hypothetical protein
MAMKKGTKGGTRKKSRTAKQKAASLRNLAKARSARRRATKRHTVRAHSYNRTAKLVHVPEHKSWESPRSPRRSKRSKQTPKQRAASLRNLRKARAARGGRHASERRGKSRSRSSGHRRSSEMVYEERSTRRPRRRRARKNPLGAMEIFFGGFTFLVWFGVTDFADRMIATHALTDKGTKDAAGNELYADTPPTSGSYKGLFNSTAITAPMNLTRWLAGGMFIVVPLGLANIKGLGDVGKGAMQMMGYGAVARVLGKGLIDLLAFLTKTTATGQRLYDGELRAAALENEAAGTTPSIPSSSLPSAGLGKPAGKSAGCACGGTCTSCQAVAARMKAGAGWPSMPREVAPAAPPPALAPPPPPPPPPAVARPLTGVPATRTNPYRWGEERAA